MVYSKTSLYRTHCKTKSSSKREISIFLIRIPSVRHRAKTSRRWRRGETVDDRPETRNARATACACRWRPVDLSSTDVDLPPLLHGEICRPRRAGPVLRTLTWSRRGRAGCTTRTYFITTQNPEPVVPSWCSSRERPGTRGTTLSPTPWSRRTCPRNRCRRRVVPCRGLNGGTVPSRGGGARALPSRVRDGGAVPSRGNSADAESSHERDRRAVPFHECGGSATSYNDGRFGIRCGDYGWRSWGRWFVWYPIIFRELFVLYYRLKSYYS